MAEMYSQTRRDKFYRFMDLPPEIRDLIYSFVLYKGTVIVPNSGRVRGDPRAVKHYRTDDGYYYLRYQGLEQQLLEMESGHRASSPLGLLQGVSRQVHDEAARIFFGRNHFIFPAGRFDRPTYCNLLDIFRRSSLSAMAHDVRNRTNNAPLLKDVSYTFDMRDRPGDDYRNLYWNFNLKHSIDARTISRREALQALHDQKTARLGVDWVERIDCIKRMDLDRLVLSFEECYCAVGCCRMVEWVLERFLHEGPPPGTAGNARVNAYSSFNWVSGPPLLIEVMGFVDDDEEAMALDKLRRLPDSEVRLSTISDAQDELEDGTAHNGLMGPAMFLDD